MFIVLSRVPYHAYPFKGMLKNIDLIILTDNRFLKDYKLNQLNVFGFDNYVENEEVLQKVLEISKMNKIEFIYAVDESDVERAALLRELTKVNGQGYVSAKLYRDKFLMKEVLKYKVKLPQFKSVSTKEEAIEKWLSFDFPTVIKPRKSWASSKMYILKNVEDINKVRDYKNCMLEEWINSQVMYTVDGIQKNGNILNAFIHEYDRSILESLEKNKDGFAMLTSKKNSDQKFLNEIQKYLETIIQTLNNGDNFTSPFHLEFFIDENLDFCFCEIACRFGGGKTLDLINRAFGVNLAEDFLAASSNKMDLKNIEKKSVTNYYAYYKQYNDKYRNKEAESPEWIVSINKNPRERNSTPTNINDVEATYLFKGTSTEDCISKIKTIESGKLYE